MLISRNLYNKNSEVSIKTRSAQASPSFKGLATKFKCSSKLIFKVLETIGSIKHKGRQCGQTLSLILLYLRICGIPLALGGSAYCFYQCGGKKEYYVWSI